jgi:hypothetical protein
MSMKSVQSVLKISSYLDVTIFGESFLPEVVLKQTTALSLKAVARHWQVWW